MDKKELEKAQEVVQEVQKTVPTEDKIVDVVAQENTPESKGFLEDYIAEVLCIVMVIAIILQVFFRFVVQRPLGWTEELATTCFVMMVYVGSIGATRKDSHLKLELFTNMIKSEKGRLRFSIIGDIVFFIVGLILAYAIVGIAMNLKASGMTTSMLHWPKWILYMVLPISLVLIDVRLIQNMIHKVKRIKEIDSGSPDAFAGQKEA